MNKPRYNELALVTIEPHPTIPYAYGQFLAVVTESHIDKNKYFELYYPFNVEMGRVAYKVANEEWKQLKKFVCVDDLPDWTAYAWMKGVNGFVQGMVKYDKEYYLNEVFNNSSIRLFGDEYLFKLKQNSSEEYLRQHSSIQSISEFKSLYYPNAETLQNINTTKELQKLTKLIC